MSLAHYVCFECHKQYKKNAFSSRQTLAIPRRGGNGKVRGYVVRAKPLTHHPCPQCGAEMHPMGKRFRAPKQGDTEGWTVAERLYRAGFRFHARRGRMPTRLRDVPDFLAAHQYRSEGEQLLARWKEQA